MQKTRLSSYLICSHVRSRKLQSSATNKLQREIPILPTEEHIVLAEDISWLKCGHRGDRWLPCEKMHMKSSNGSPMSQQYLLFCSRPSPDVAWSRPQINSLYEALQISVSVFFCCSYQPLLDKQAWVLLQGKCMHKLKSSSWWADYLKIFFNVSAEPSATQDCKAILWLTSCAERALANCNDFILRWTKLAAICVKAGPLCVSIESIYAWKGILTGLLLHISSILWWDLGFVSPRNRAVVINPYGILDFTLHDTDKSIVVAVCLIGALLSYVHQSCMTKSAMCVWTEENMGNPIVWSHGPTSHDPRKNCWPDLPVKSF